VPSSLLRVSLSGPVIGGLSFVLTWDATPDGWAALLRWWDSSGALPKLKGLLLVGSWPAGEAISDQARREALAAPLALKAACQAVDLRVCLGLLRIDAEAAIGALAKGSTGSPEMQRQAVRLNRVACTNELELVLAHVPGLALVEAGINADSTAPPGALARRPRPPCWSFGDLEGLRRLRDVILSRPAGWPGGPQGGPH